MPDLAVTVSESDHSRGSADAPITLVEYGDYECPYCGRSAPIIERLRDTHGERLRFVFRHFPLNSVHPRAAVMAQAAEAAGAQGKFWQMHDLLYSLQDELEDWAPDRLALRLGLEVYQFDADLSGGRFAARVEADVAGGRRSGVGGTPTFFVNGVRVAGKTEDDLRAAVEGAG